MKSTINTLNNPFKHQLINERAQRLKILRSITGYTQDEFCQKYAIAQTTVKYWETGRGNGLSKKGADKIIKALINDGIQCNSEWLLSGLGRWPQKQNKELIYSNGFIQETSAHYAVDDQKNIQEELAVFMKKKEAISTLIDDDGLGPFLIKGDIVGGVRRYDKNLNSIIGKSCIIEMLNGQIICRQLHTGIDPEYFTLSCLNPTTGVLEPILYNIKIISAAPIVWIRKPDN